MMLNNSNGKITDTVYAFNNSSDDNVNDGTPVEVLNPAYFTGDYANYNIRYALGASELVAAEGAGGDKKMNSKTAEYYFNLKSEKENKTISGTVLNQAITIVANRKSAGGSAPAGKPMEFEGPCVATVANLPFTNISARSNRPESRLFIPGTAITNDIHSQLEAASLTATPAIAAYKQQYVRGSDVIQDSYANLSIGKPISCTKTSGDPNHIYVVYAYADELKAS